MLSIMRFVNKIRFAVFTWLRQDDPCGSTERNGKRRPRCTRPKGCVASSPQGARPPHQPATEDGKPDWDILPIGEIVSPIEFVKPL